MMKMSQIAKLQSICNQENVLLEVIKAPRYIIPFLVDYEEDVILIRKEGTMQMPFTPVAKVKEESPEEDFDLTGSPLHTSLDDSLIYNPINQAQLGVHEYFNHSPLSVDQALRIINLFMSSSNATFEEKELPIWVLCDAADKNHTVLMTLWRRDDGWVMRGNAVMAPLHLFLQSSNPSLDAMLKDHLKMSRAEKSNVSYMAKACYSCNKNEVSETMDEFSDNAASLKIHLSWKRPHTHFSHPPYDATSNFAMNVTVGCEGSQLWQEIERLREINGFMLNSPSEKENQFLTSMATMNMTVMASALRSQVHSFVCNGKLPPSFKLPKLQSAPKIGIAHILDIYEEVADGRRQNTDVTEVLWSILKGCTDLVELNSCFKMIIREAASGRFTPKIVSDNKTSVAKIIQGAQDILQTMSLKVKGNEAWRLLWELGLLKLQRDYKYMLQRLELKSSGQSDPFIGLKIFSSVMKEQREEGIETLIAVHSFIETLMLLKSQLNLDAESLSLLTKAVLPKLTLSALEFANSSARRSLDCSYMDAGLQQMFFSIPLQTKISMALVKGCHPVSWSFSLSTVKNKRKIVNIFLESNDGIFPPAINEKGDRAVSNTKDNTIIKFTLLGDHVYLRE